jgi:hypothetical protein
MSNKWIIKDADGNITNPCILADEAFVQSISEHYELYVAPTPVEPTAEETARQWRGMELSSSDQAAQTPDWPNRDNILTYRAALRDWPSTSDFPENRPIL